MSVAATGSKRWSLRGGVFVTAILCVLTLALLVLFHVGFQASDDAEYLTGALGWIEHFPYVGDTHWTLRHTITLPTALFVLLLGLNETAVSLSNILYFLAFLGVNAWFMREHVGGTAAAFATALLIVLPGFTVVATYLNSDVPELFFVSVAFWLLVTARKNPDRHAIWILIGAVLGAAFVTRQTALAAVLFVSALCAFRPAVPRSRYFLAGAAFLIVVAADWMYLTAMTGDSLYRMNVDFHHDRVDRMAEAARLATGGGLLDKEGNLSVNVFLDPLLALFVTQKYALLFWLLLPAGVYAWRRRSLPPADVLALAAGLGIAYFLFVAVEPKALPRTPVPHRRRVVCIDHRRVVACKSMGRRPTPRCRRHLAGRTCWFGRAFGREYESALRRSVSCCHGSHCTRTSPCTRIPKPLFGRVTTSASPANPWTRSVPSGPRRAQRFCTARIESGSARQCHDARIAQPTSSRHLTGLACNRRKRRPSLSAG